MPRPATSNVLPYELLAFLRAPLAKRLISTRALQIWYLQMSRLISRRSRRFLITAIPAVQRQLRWAMLLALLRTYILFMRRIILDPRSGFERSLNRHGGWMLLVALRERFKARVKKSIEGAPGGNAQGPQDFVTPPTSPAGSISSHNSFMSVPDYFLKSPETDPILRAVRQVIPDATGYKVVMPRPPTEDGGQEFASNELARRISGKNVETKAYYKDGLIRTPPTSESGRQKVVSLVIMEDYGDRKSIRGAVTVDTNVGNKVDTKKIEDLGVPFSEALAC